MRLLRTGSLDPALNMALDHALLRSETETLRLYSWQPPGLSLGRFQQAAEFSDIDGFTLVRRPTGGGAIAHIGELTLSWVGKRLPVDQAYEQVNEIVKDAYRRLGGRLLQPGADAPTPAPRGYCFDSATHYDLLAGGGKLFGSAQRRSHRWFLLHGTLVLEPNPLSRGAISLRECLGRPVPLLEAEAAVAAAAARRWNVELVEGEPSPEEWAVARDLVVQRYAAPEWTHRR